MLKRILAGGLVVLTLSAGFAAPPNARYDKFRKAGDQALARKDYATAIKEFERLVYLFPDNVEAYNALGYAYFLDQKYPTAILQFKQALQFNPRHPAALNNLMLAVGKRALEQAQELEFSEAIGLLASTEAAYPTHPQAVVLRYSQGQMEFYRGNEEAGLRLWQSVASRVPSSGTAKFIEAHKLYAAGNPKSALPAMKAAQAKLPKEPVVRNYLALILADLGKYPEAIAQLQKAQQGNPPYIDLYLNLANIHLRASNPELALAQLTKARDLRPDYATVHLTMAALHRQSGNTEASLKEAGLGLADGSEPALLVTGEGTHTVWLDGKQIGVSPLGLLVKPGKHRLKVAAKGQASQTAEFEVAADQMAYATAGATLQVEQVPLAQAVPQARAARSFALRDQSNKFWRSFQHFHRRPVVLLFWHEGDPVNDETLRALSELGAVYGDKIGCAVIHTDVANKNQALSQMMSLPATYARLFDDGSVSRRYGLSNEQLPAVVVVDLDGYIAAQGQGVAGVQSARQALDKLVQ